MTPKRRIFYGWWVVLSSSAVIFLTGGLGYYSLSAYFDSIVAEYGWKRAVISGAYSLRGLETGILTPVVGFFIDRLGPRPVFVFGVTFTSLGLFLLGRINSLVTFYAAFAVISLGLSASGIVVAMTATANWFVRNRGKALGLATAGGGMAGLLVTMVAWLILSLGWRQATLVSAAIILTGGVPLSLLVRHRPEDYGYLPDGRSSVAESGAESNSLARAHSEEKAFTAKQALRTSSFWWISLAMALPYVGVSGVIVHEMPFLTSIGFSPGFAALVMTLTTLFSLGGRVGLSWLTSTYSTRLLMLVGVLMTAAGLVVLGVTDRTWQIALFLLTFGLGYAARAPLGATLQGEYFGRASFGAIQGLLHSVMLLFGIAGPILTGWIFDISGSYSLAFFILAGITLLAVPFLLIARPPTPPSPM